MKAVVLVVEDDADQREQLCGFLRSLTLDVPQRVLRCMLHRREV